MIGETQKLLCGIIAATVMAASSASAGLDDDATWLDLPDTYRGIWANNCESPKNILVITGMGLIKTIHQEMRGISYLLVGPGSLGIDACSGNDRKARRSINRYSNCPSISHT